MHRSSGPTPATSSRVRPAARRPSHGTSCCSCHHAGLASECFRTSRACAKSSGPLHASVRSDSLEISHVSTYPCMFIWCVMCALVWFGLCRALGGPTYWVQWTCVCRLCESAFLVRNRSVPAAIGYLKWREEASRTFRSRVKMLTRAGKPHCVSPRASRWSRPPARQPQRVYGFKMESASINNETPNR